MYTRGHQLPERRELCNNIKHTQLHSFSPFVTMGQNYPNHPWINLWGQTYLPLSRKGLLLEAWQVITRLWLIADIWLRLRHLVPKSDWTTSGWPLNLALSSLYRALLLLLLLHSSFISSALLLSIAWCCVFAVHCTCIPSKWIKKREREKKKKEQDEKESVCLISSAYLCLFFHSWYVRVYLSSRPNYEVQRAVFFNHEKMMQYKIRFIVSSCTKCIWF